MYTLAIGGFAIFIAGGITLLARAEPARRQEVDLLDLQADLGPKAPVSPMALELISLERRTANATAAAVALSGMLIAITGALIPEVQRARAKRREVALGGGPSPLSIGLHGRF